jgi:mitochondrial intermembrane space import and assembly protein 40
MSSYARTEEDGKDVLVFITESDALKHDQSQSTAEASSSEEATSTEEQAQEAYNEETGEINWDCPCIAPMVKPPCGEVFKEAFSCFVHSTEGTRD